MENVQSFGILQGHYIKWTSTYTAENVSVVYNKYPAQAWYEQSLTQVDKSLLSTRPAHSSSVAKCL